MRMTSASYRSNSIRHFVWIGCLVVFFITHFLSSTIAQTTSTWDGSTGFWSDFTHWSTDPFFPDNGNGGVDYLAIINGGTVTLDVDVTLDGLNLLGGTLTGSNDLTVETFILDNNATLSTSGAFNITGAASLNSGTISRNLTLAAVSGNVIRNVTIDDGFTLTNSFGATLTANATSSQVTGGLGSVVNDGTFNKVGGSRYTVEAGFTNNGLVDVQSGQFRTGAATHNGQVNIASGARFEVNGDSTFDVGSSVTGLGTLSLLNGTATINGSVTAAEIFLDGATLTGNGSLTVDRFFFHQNGTLARDLTLTQTANHEIRDLTIDDGFTLTNPNGATLTANTTSAHLTGGLGSVVNDGTFNKVGGFRYTVATEFTNNGLIDVQSGQFRTGAATHTGQVNIASGARFEVNGDSTFDAGTSVTGLGTFLLNNGTATIDGSVTAAEFTIEGGTLTGTGSLTPDRFFFHNFGTLARDLTLTQTANHEIRNVTIDEGFTLTNPNGATLLANTGSALQTDGLGSWVNDGLINVQGGTSRYTVATEFTNNGLIDVQSGQFRTGAATHTGQVNIASGARFEVNGDSTFDAGTSVTGLGTFLLNNGTATIDGSVTAAEFTIEGGTLTGTGSLTPDRFFFHNFGTLARDLTLTQTANHEIRNVTIDEGFTLTNPNGATLLANTGSALQTDGLGSWVNDGLINVQGGTSRYTVATEFTNNGLIDVQSGQFRTGAATHTGQVNIASGARFEVNGDSTFDAGTSVTGLGTFLLNNGTATIDGSVTAAEFTIEGGTLTGTGSLTPDRFFFHNFGTLARDLTLTQTANHEIRNVTIDEGFTLTNPNGATLLANTGSALQTDGLGSWVNDGLINVQGGTSRYTVATEFTNNGLIDLQTGRFQTGATATHNGQVNVASGSTFEAFGDSTFNVGSSVTGAGSLLLWDGTATIDGSVTASQVAFFAGGTLSGSGSLTPDRFYFHSGTLARDLTLTQTANHEIRNLTIDDGFTLTNPNGATLTANTVAAHLTDGLGSLVNDGTFIKVGGFRFTMETAFTNNSLVDVQSGQFRTGTATHNGQVNVASGATFEVAGTQDFTSGSTITGAGSVLVTGLGQMNVVGEGGHTYSGGTTIENGGDVLITGTGLGLGVGTANVNSGGSLRVTAVGNASAGTVNVNSGGVLGLENDFDPTAILNAGSSGLISLNVANFSTGLDQSTMGNGEMYVGTSGTTTFASSSLGAGTGSSYRLGGAGGTLTFNGTNTLTGANSVSIGSLQTNGAGTVVLSAANNHSGGTTVNSGSTLLIDHTDALGSGALNLNGGAIGSTSGTLTVNNSVNLTGNVVLAPNSTDVEFVSPITLSGDRSVTVVDPAVLTFSGDLGDGFNGYGITKLGTGELVFSGTNTFSGGITIDSGTVRTVNSNQSLGLGSVTVNSGASLRQFSFLNLGGGQSVLVNSGGVLGLDGDFPPLVDPASSGIMAINISSYSQNLDMSNIGNGQMFLGSQENGTYTHSTLGPGAGAAYRLGGAGGSLTISQTNVLTGFNTLLIGSTQTNGAGTVVLEMDQDFFGNTLVESGSCLVLNGNLTGPGNIFVLPGGSVKGGGIHGKSAQVNGTGTLAPGQSAGLIGFSDALEFMADSKLEWELAALITSNPGADWDQIELVDGDLTIHPDSLIELNFIDAASAPDGSRFWQTTQRWNNIINLTGASTNSSGQFGMLIDNSAWSSFGMFETQTAVSGAGIDLVWQSTSVPEPSTLALLCLAACAAGLRRKMRPRH